MTQILQHFDGDLTPNNLRKKTTCYHMIAIQLIAVGDNFLMGQVEGNNDSNRNNDIILDGRQLLSTQRHFPNLLLHFRMFKIRLLSNNFKTTEFFLETPLVVVGHYIGLGCRIMT